MVALSLVLTLGGGGCGSGSASSSTTTTDTVTAQQAERSPGKTPPPQSEGSPGASVTGYGAPARGSSRAAVIAAAHSFFTAMANDDDARVCSLLAASNREQLRKFVESRSSGNCPAALKTLLHSGSATEGRKAAQARVTGVRIEKGSAFVLFRPAGGMPSYFVMKKEGGEWKAISLEPGTPIDPTAAP